jgi:hypothetical protein
MHSRFTRLAGTAVLTGFTVASLFAVAPNAANADEQDPGVVRISLLNGGVDVKRADSGDTVAAVVNAPLNAGDYLSTQDDSRAELQLDDLTELRVAPDTQLRFTTMTSSSNALQLAQGTVELRLFRGNGANPEIDTPNASVRPRGNGAFRVTVDNDGNAVVTVRSGEATVSTQNDSQTISSGSIVVEGNAGSAQFQSIDTVADDGFDAFNSDRDQHEADAPSYAYVNDQFVGADDLDQYGAWQNVDGYGEVWHPHYASGWAPYQDGSWTWEPYYGWTWVSAEPWGWAPYHYGRWFYASNNGGWCWTPATQYFQPVYRPAQVAFFSFGFGDGGGGISIGFGNVGWVALGPTDPFHPWWGGNGGYGGRGYGGGTTINNITNITNITTITNINNYHNINSPGAIVAVRNANFQQGNFTRRIAVTPAQLRTANITTVRGIVPIVPTPRNLAYNGAEPAAKRFPLSPTFDRFKPVVARTNAATFAEQRSAVSAVAQRVYPNEAKNFEREAPAVADPRTEQRTVPVLRGDAGSDARVSSEQRQPALEQTQPSSPWNRFAKPGSPDEGAVPKVTDVRATNGEAERGAKTEQARPSYAQPDTSERRAVSEPKSATPQVETVTSERSTSSPWDRFGGTRPAREPATSSHAASGDDETQPATHGEARSTYSAPRTSPSYSAPRRSTTEYGDGSTQSQTQHDSEPAATPRHATAPSYGSSTYARPVERPAASAHPAPVTRTAPAERSAPAHAAPAAHQGGSSGDRPDSTHDKHN